MPTSGDGRLEEEIGNEEAQKAKTCYDLHRYASRRGLLDSHARGARGDSLLVVLNNTFRLPLSQGLVRHLLRQT